MACANLTLRSLLKSTWQKLAVVAAVTTLFSSPAMAHDFSFQTLLETSDITLAPGVTALFDESGFAGDGFTTVTEDLDNNFRPIEMYDVRMGQTPTVVSTGGLTEPANGDPFASTINPHGNGTATSFYGIAVDDQGIDSARGVYLNQSPVSTMETVAITGQSLTGLAGVTAPLTRLGSPVLAGGNLAFKIETDGDLATEYHAIVSRPISPAENASFTTLVDTNTAVPGRMDETFLSIDLASSGYDGNRAAFHAVYDFEPIFSGDGIYSVTAGSAPTSIIEAGTFLPGVGSKYNLGAPLIDGENTVFNVVRLMSGGIYVANDAGITPIVTTQTPLPHAADSTFLAPFSFFAADGGRVAFFGKGSDDSNGVYLYDGGEIVPVLTTLDQKDGFQVALTDISRNGFVGDQLILDVVLADNENMSFISQVVLVDLLDDSFGLTCDADGDGDCDLGDLDELYAAVDTAGGPFDFDGDGTVAAGDIIEWLMSASDATNTALLDPNDVLVLGDIDLNGDVNSSDLGLLLNNFGRGPDSNWAQGDLDGNGQVNSTDLGLLLNNFGHLSLSTSAVPEPDCPLALMLACSFALATLRRRNETKK